MKKILLLIGLFSKLTILSQTQIFIVDSISKTPLKFARINFGEFGMYTNEKGYFILKNDELPDKFTISFIGYKTKYYNLKEKKRIDTIFLERKPINLEEVILTNHRKEIKIRLPHINKFTFRSFPLQKKQEIISILKPRDSLFKGFIKSITLHFSKITLNKKKYKKISYAVIRVNIYKINSIDTIIKTIYSSSPIKINKLKKNKLKLDLENENIITDNGVAIGIEYIGHIDNFGNLLTNSSLIIRPSLTDKESYIFKQKTFVRNSITKKTIMPSVSKYLTEQMHNNKKYIRNLAIGFTIN